MAEGLFESGAASCGGAPNHRRRREAGFGGASVVRGQKTGAELSASGTGRGLYTPEKMLTKYVRPRKTIKLHITSYLLNNFSLFSLIFYRYNNAIKVKTTTRPNIGTGDYINLIPSSFSFFLSSFLVAETAAE